MNQLTSEAIVLDVRPYRDYDVMARLLSPTLGVFSAAAYAAARSRKRFPSGVDHLTRVQVELRHQNERYLMKSLTVQDPYWTLKSDFDRTCVASLLCEVLARAHLETSEWSTAYVLAQETLEGLDLLPSVEPISASVFVLMKLLKLLGFLHPAPICRPCDNGAFLSRAMLDLQDGTLRCEKHPPEHPGPLLSPPGMMLWIAATGFEKLSGIMAHWEQHQGWEPAHARTLLQSLVYLSQPAFGSLRSLRFLQGSAA